MCINYLLISSITPKINFPNGIILRKKVVDAKEFFEYTPGILRAYVKPFIFFAIYSYFFFLYVLLIVYASVNRKYYQGALPFDSLHYCKKKRAHFDSLSFCLSDVIERKIGAKFLWGEVSKLDF